MFKRINVRPVTDFSSLNYVLQVDDDNLTMLT